MTDKNRFIELVDKAKEEYANDITDHTETDYIVETLLNEGAILPPCKAGDKVWYVRDGKINKAKIEESIYSASKHGYFSEDWRFHAYNFSKKEEITFWLDDIGKTVFLTKEEAERALAERSKDNA